MNNAIYLSQPQIAVKQSRTPLVLDMAGQGAGKTLNIGFDTFEKIRAVPQIKGFIGANTYLQLSQSTLNRAFATWKLLGGWEQYDKVSNPEGVFVVDRKPPAHFQQFEILKNYRNTICFANGCLIFTGSLDNYMAHDGKEFGWAHLDETKDTKKEAVTQVILARLRQTGMFYAENIAGRPYFYDGNITQEEAMLKNYIAYNPCIIHTSPSYGGVDWLIELFGFDKDEQEIRTTLAKPQGFYIKTTEFNTVVIYGTHWNWKNLPPNYIRNRRAQLTSHEQVMYLDGYPFGKTGNEYFASFQRRIHVVKKVPFRFDKTFHVSFDFNVVPYVTGIVSQIDYITKYYNDDRQEKKDFLEDDDVGYRPLEVMRILIGKEYCLKPPHNETEQLCDNLGQWLVDNEATADVLTYGDASGMSRIPGLGSLTNFKIIKRILDKYVYNENKTGKFNVSVLKRKKLLNRIFEGKFPEIEIYISEDCVELIRDLEFLKQAPDGGKFKEKEIDPTTGKSYEKIGHTSDALEYFICKLLEYYLKDID